jgi:amino acid adenylation domain-containing protein
VPLDPGFPVDRLSYMASDAGLSAILVPAALAAPFVNTGVPLLDPVDLALLAAACPAPLAADAERDARPLDAAYLIYTSGSTGLPKAVAVPHRAVVNFLVAMGRSPGLREEDRLVAVTTLSFDIAVLELLLPLAIGAQVIVANRDQVADPMQLRALLERHEATVMQATPSTWRALIDTGWTGGAGFRALIGGEPLQVALAEQLIGHCAALWNMYGPTETTVWSTLWQVEEPRKGISIGRPIANTSVWVLDAMGQVCPIGVPGEAFIGGLGVTLGYHHRDALTAERFVPDPWGNEADARLYRTGDLCRWRHDGLLEHLGRLDHQVKVRGFRIELGEIESVLLNHPSVAQCVVVTRAEDRDDVRLVAYVVIDGSEIQTSALRDHLSASLPGYMLPQHLVKLTALPLLPNGKIDRGALPAPDVQPARAPASSHRPPVTHEEKVIAAIWEKLLGIEHVERTDNFFDLGGHSLLAMSAVAAAKQQLDWRIEPRRLVFETLQQLANPANK